MVCEATGRDANGGARAGARALLMGCGSAERQGRNGAANVHSGCGTTQCIIGEKPRGKGEGLVRAGEWIIPAREGSRRHRKCGVNSGDQLGSDQPDVAGSSRTFCEPSFC